MKRTGILLFAAIFMVSLSACNDDDDNKNKGPEDNYAQARETISKLAGLWEATSAEGWDIEDGKKTEWAGPITENYQGYFVFNTYDPEKEVQGRAYLIDNDNVHIVRWALDGEDKVKVMYLGMTGQPTDEDDYYTITELTSSRLVFEDKEDDDYYEKITFSKSSLKADMYSPSQLAGRWIMKELAYGIFDSNGNRVPVTSAEPPYEIGFEFDINSTSTFYPGIYFEEDEEDPIGWMVLYNILGFGLLADGTMNIGTNYITEMNDKFMTLENMDDEEYATIRFEKVITE